MQQDNGMGDGRRSPLRVGEKVKQVGTGAVYVIDAINGDAAVCVKHSRSASRAKRRAKSGKPTVEIPLDQLRRMHEEVALGHLTMNPRSI